MCKIVYDYSLLRGLIKRKFVTNKALCDKMGMDESSLSNKLNNKTYFTQEQIQNASTLLEISNEDIIKYFFSLEC